MERTRVIIADDESLIRMDLREMLTNLGYLVVGEVADGLSAVNQARELKPNVVIMDIKMADMDGIEAAKVLTEERVAPVVLLSAYSQRELVDRAEAGVVAYWLLPLKTYPGHRGRAGAVSGVSGIAEAGHRPTAGTGDPQAGGQGQGNPDGQAGADGSGSLSQDPEDEHGQSESDERRGRGDHPGLPGRPGLNRRLSAIGQEEAVRPEPDGFVGPARNPGSWMRP
jgi:CheY-like chemotaxis protein